jgi:hypothetical protein
LPIAMLGIRTSLNNDLECSFAQLVYNSAMFTQISPWENDEMKFLTTRHYVADIFITGWMGLDISVIEGSC